MTMTGAALFFTGTLYTCYPATTIFGEADVKLSNGKTFDTGHTQNECKRECAANAACKSFVFDAHSENETRCEMWSKTTGTSRQDGTQHCVKNIGEHTSEHMVALQP